jgi:hypothetical protein
MAAYGLSVTKGETVVVRDATVTDGVAAAVFGLQRQDVADAYLKIDSLSTKAEAQKKAKKEITVNLRRYLQAKDADDEKLAEQYLRRATLWIQMGRFNPQEIPSVLTQAFSGNQTLIDNINMKFNFTKAPPERMK